MRKKILIISPGPAMSVDTLKLSILSEYFEGAIITSAFNDEVIKETSVFSFKHHCMKYDSRSKIRNNLKFILFAIKFALSEKKENEKYHLVTTYDPLKTGLIGLLCSKILNSKFAPEIAGTYTSRLNYVDEKPVLAFVKYHLYKRIMRFVISQSDGVKYQYKSQLDDFEKIIKGKTTSYFPNLINFNRDTTVKERSEILIVGFPFYRKGIDVAINAFKEIASHHPDWKLRILGWFPDLTELKNHMGNHPQIIYTSPIGHAEMPKYIGACSIFITPSRSEGVPRVLIEAMMAGKPLIGSNIDGIPELITDGENGLLFEQGDYVSLSEKMELLIKTPKLREEFSRINIIKADDYTPEKYWNKLISFYKSMLG